MRGRIPTLPRGKGSVGETWVSPACLGPAGLSAGGGFGGGLAGALLAVPMMSALRIFCDHVDGLQRFGHLLGGTDETVADVIMRVSGTLLVA